MPHIAGLEKEVGNQLLVRHVPLELTYAGQVFLEYAMDFQRKLNSMQQDFSDISGNQKGLLSIGIGSTRGRAIMPILIEEFQKQYPQIAVRLFEASNGLLRQNLIDGEIDLAIANFSESITGVELHDFYEDEIVLMVSNELLDTVYGDATEAIIQKIDSGNLSVLQSCPFLINSPLDIAGRIGRSFLQQAGVLPFVKVEALNVETLLDLCARGVGACFTPELLARTTLSAHQMKKLRVFHFGKDARYMIRFGYRKQAYCWSVITNFIEIARGLIPEHLYAEKSLL